ncbi:MAG: hypothetical protein HY074_02940 [Deltaproteobacteria bacterium]|nr:hypothetical protein [Deltaproteobacteria bacterium]
MKNLGIILALVSMFAVSMNSTSYASFRKKSKDADAIARQSGVLKADSSSSRYEMTTLASDSPSSILGKTELTAQAGTAIISGFTAGIFNFRGAYKLPVPALLYGEAGLGFAFNTDKVVLPIDFGARFNLRISGAPAVQPFAHLSLGPALATSGKSVMFHMFFGPGVMYRVSRSYDLRLDAGMVVFNDSTGFQATAGVAL